LGAIALSPDGARLAMGPPQLHGYPDKDEKGPYPIDVWDLRTGTIVATLDAGNPYLQTLSWSPDSRLLLSVTNENTGSGEARLWDASTFRRIAETNVTCFEEMAWSPDSRWVSVAGCHMHLGVLKPDGKTWQRVHEVASNDGAAAQLTPIFASKDGKRLFYFVQ